MGTTQRMAKSVNSVVNFRLWLRNHCWVTFRYCGDGSPYVNEHSFIDTSFTEQLVASGQTELVF